MYDYDYDYDDYDDDPGEYESDSDAPESKPNEAAYDQALEELTIDVVASGEFASVYWRLIAEDLYDEGSWEGCTTAEIVHEMVTEEVVPAWHKRYEERAEELADEEGECFDANYGDPCGCSSPYCPCSGPGKFGPL